MAMVCASRRLSAATLWCRTCSESPRREDCRLPKAWTIDSSLLIELSLEVRPAGTGPQGKPPRAPVTAGGRANVLRGVFGTVFDTGADVSAGLAVFWRSGGIAGRSTLRTCPDWPAYVSPLRHMIQRSRQRNSGRLRGNIRRFCVLLPAETTQ